MTNNQYDYVVVGAGLAGLTAAVYLARTGASVLLTEKTEGCGGLIGSMEKDGFTFDAGARSIENAGVIRAMLKELEIDLELLESPVSIGIEDRMVDMSREDFLAEYRRMLEELYPGYSKDLGRIFQSIEKVLKDMEVIYGFDNPVFRDYRTDKDYLMKELLPWMVRFLPSVGRMGRMNEPIESFLNRISSCTSLNDIIDQHFFKKTPMFFALGYYYVYRDYFYPKGGTGRLPEALAEKLVSLGGEIRYETEINRVDPLAKRVEARNGFSCSYGTLLWCGDQKALYRSIDPSGLDRKTRKKTEWIKQAYAETRGGDSVLSLFLGVDRPLEEFSAVANGHLFYTPSRKGLGEVHRSELTDLIASETAGRDEILDWLERYSRLTTYEVSIPSMRDPDLSPEGKTGIIVSYLLEYDLVRKVEAAGWYPEFKQAVEDSMIRVLDESLFPGLTNSIVTRFSASPLSIERRFGNSEGGITGWTFERKLPVIDQLTKIRKSVKSPFPDLYQAGQWVYSPAGIPTAILTGWYAYDAIMGKAAYSR